MDPTDAAQIGLNILLFSPLAFTAICWTLGLARGWFVLGWTYRDKCKESDAWKALYQKSQDTLGEVRQTALIDRARSDAAVDAARISARLLEAIQSGSGHAPAQP